MDINTHNVQNAQINNTSSTNNQLLDPNMFLKLLITQIQNQDPLNQSSDPTAQMAQLAQFSMIEQLNQMNTTIENSQNLSMINQSASLIGKNVVIDLGDEGQVTGNVDKVSINGGIPFLVVNDKEYSIYQVTEINE